MELRIVDDNNVAWLWNGARLRVEGSDEEAAAEGTPLEENGYEVSTFEDAVAALDEGGFVEQKCPRIYAVKYTVDTNSAYYVPGANQRTMYFVDRHSAVVFATMRGRTLHAVWLEGAYRDVPPELLVRILNGEGIQHVSGALIK